MKTKLLLLLIFFASVGYSQNHPDSIYFTHAKNRAYLNNHFTFWMLAYYDLYEKECCDTIKAKPFKDQFLIDHGSYGEMVTEQQLNKRGYIYDYRIIIKFDPMELEYYFIKEPTLKYFMLWLKKQ